MLHGSWERTKICAICILVLSYHCTFWWEILSAQLFPQSFGVALGRGLFGIFYPFGYDSLFWFSFFSEKECRSSKAIIRLWNIWSCFNVYEASLLLFDTFFCSWYKYLFFCNCWRLPLCLPGINHILRTLKSRCCFILFWHGNGIRLILSVIWIQCNTYSWMNISTLRPIYETTQQQSSADTGAHGLPVSAIKKCRLPCRHQCPRSFFHVPGQGWIWISANTIFHVHRTLSSRAIVRGRAFVWFRNEFLMFFF